MNNKTNKIRVLQLNLDGTGGAFSLIYQYGLILNQSCLFDFYWPGNYFDSPKIDQLKKLGSKFYSDQSTGNRLIDHIILPFKFYKFLRSHKYSIIHINTDMAYKMAMYAIPAKLFGVQKIILHSHSSGINGDHVYLKFIFHWLAKKFLLCSTKYVRISCSNLASKWMFNLKNDVTILKNAINLDKFSYNEKSRNIIRNQLGVANKILLGMVGNLSFQKNPEFMIKILSHLDSKMILIFVGDGKNRKFLEKQAEDLNVKDRCLFLGNVNNVADFLSAFDLYVMPSRFEGLPVSAVEAQANGLPCLLSDKITTEACLLPTCKQVSLYDKPSWINSIINSSKFGHLKEAKQYLQIAGFDINDASKVLLKIYQFDQ